MNNTIFRGGLALLGPLFLCLPVLAEDDVIRLDPIRVSGSATEFLQQDFIQPSTQKKIKLPSGSGSLDQSLTRDYAIQVTTSGSPGTLTQFRGFGVRSEDTSVQALGISLNPGYGGGLDLSTIPQFLWSDYRYSIGPSSATFDPRSSSGTLSLVPWTALAIEQNKVRVPNVQGLASSINQYQLAVGANSSDVAAIAGYSYGQNSGPSGTLSAKKVLGTQDAIRFHLLATDLTANLPRYGLTLTPNTTQRTQRVIPILSWDHVTEKTASKLTLFSDLTNLDYRSPDGAFPTFTYDQARQYGAHYALGVGSTRIGILGKKLIYRTSVPTPDEDMGQIQIIKGWGYNKLMIEPWVRGTVVSGYGVLPEGALGLRLELSPEFRFFHRSAYTRRFPTLSDRFYTLAGLSEANPNLTPETNYSFTLGIETTVLNRLQNLLQLTYQLSEDIHQFLPVSPTKLGPFGDPIYSTQNAGFGQMLTLFHNIQVDVMPWFEVTKSFSINLSRLDRTRAKYNYLPWAKNVYIFRFHEPSEDRWSASIVHQWVSETVTPTKSLASYLVADLAFDYRIGGWFTIGAKVENIANHLYEVKANEPVPGRTYILNLSAVL